jgi:hypothetical protein
MRVIQIGRSFEKDPSGVNRSGLESWCRCQSYKTIEIWLECTRPQKCFHIWNYYICCVSATLFVLTHGKERVFWSNLVFFYNKNKIMTKLFIVNMRKSHFYEQSLVLLGPMISKFLHVQMRKINIPKQQSLRALVLSLWQNLILYHHVPGKPHCSSSLLQSLWDSLILNGIVRSLPLVWGTMTSSRIRLG